MVGMWDGSRDDEQWPGRPDSGASQSYRSAAASSMAGDGMDIPPDPTASSDLFFLRPQAEKLKATTGTVRVA